MVDNTEQQNTKEQEQIEKQKQVNRLLIGHNDTFQKDYKFEEAGLEFTIKLKAQSMMDEARTQAILENMFSGYAQLTLRGTLGEGYRMVAMIAYQIEKYGLQDGTIIVPEFLRDPEKVYNFYIPATIFRDYQEWLRQFHY